MIEIRFIEYLHTISIKILDLARDARRQESEVRSQESGVRGQESGVRSQKMEDRRLDRAGSLMGCACPGEMICAIFYRNLCLILVERMQVAMKHGRRIFWHSPHNRRNWKYGKPLNID
jgi:hypothetical protein